MAEYQIIQEEQISTKDLLKKIVRVFMLLFNEWRLILISIAIGSLISLLLDLKNAKETQFYGEAQFNLEAGGGVQNALGGLGSLASAFGMPTGSSASSDLFSGGNFNLLISSKALYEKALMKTVMVNGKETLFINLYKDSSDIARNEWGGDLFNKPNVSAIKYKFETKPAEKFTKEENMIITAIYEKLVKQTTLQALDKTGTIMVLSASTNSEFLTKAWLETLLESLEEFYVEVKTRKTREIYDVQMVRLKELEGKLTSTDKQLANATFQNINAVDPTAPMRTQQITRNNTYVSTQYYNQLAAVEQLKMALINQTPLFTVLQPVRLPLIEKRVALGVNTRIGALLGFVLCIFYILLRKSYLEIKKEIF